MVKVKLVDGEWVNLPLYSKEGFYLDNGLKGNLDKVKKLNRKNWDFVVVIDGIVGAGKSKFARQLAYYVSDGKFTIDDIVFDPKQFKERILSSEKYSAIIFDEAFRGMSARAAMTQTNRILMSMLQEIRARNLFVFIVLPSVWDLDKYISLHRAQGCIHVHVVTDESKGKMRERGFFKYFNKRKMMYLLKDSKKRYEYPKSTKTKGHFTKWDPIDEKKYDDKKRKSLGDYAYDNDKPTREEDSRVYWRDTAAYLKKALQKYSNVSLKQICKEFPLIYNTICGLEPSSPPKEDIYLEKP